VKKIKYLGDKIAEKFPRLKIAIAIFLLVFGIFALVTPLTPGAWLALIGLEILGWRVIIEEKITTFRQRKKSKK